MRRALCRSRCLAHHYIAALLPVGEGGTSGGYLAEVAAEWLGCGAGLRASA